MKYKSIIVAIWLLWIPAVLLAQSAEAESAAGNLPVARPPESVEIAPKWTQRLALFGREHLQLWKGAFDFRRQNLHETAAVIGFTAGFITADSPLSRLSTTQQEGTLAKASNAVGAAASWGGSLGYIGGLYLTSLLRKDSWQEETASMAFQSVLHTSLMTLATKTLSGRERPLLENHRGRFGGIGRFSSSYESFPSGHASSVWAIASVMASRYPKPWVQWTSYGSAALVSISRVTGKKHFYADVFVGSYLGYKVGKWVVKRHNTVKPRD
jgi:membrane-associated phospholipid phosphatase